MSILNTGHAASGLPARAILSRRLQALALALAVALALIAMPASAGETTSDQRTDETAIGSGLGPSAYGYKPHVLGLSRYRAKAAKAGLTGPTQADCPQCQPLLPFEPATFKHPTKINNTWMPLQPGKQLVLRGVANRGGGLLDHLVIFTVTDLVKVIGGVPCVVVWDQDINQGVLSESELAFFAQHDNGAVYNTGEYPEVYELGQFAHAEDTWIFGIEWARAGVHVEGNPVVGKGYESGYAPENDFWDCANVYSIESRSERARPKLCLPGGCFQDLMTVREWAPLDGCDVIQVKTYAKGVGIVMVGAINDPEGETLVLEQINQLNDKEMDAARAAAMALDAHGPQVNEIYFQTQPIFRLRASHLLGPKNAEMESAAGHAFLAVGRNPISGPTAITYGLAEEGPAELAIYDVVGRQVRSLVSGRQPAGAGTAMWDGRDDSGSLVERGVYFARLRAGATNMKKTLVLTN
jgi:hypothetical protein